MVFEILERQKPLFLEGICCRLIPVMVNSDIDIFFVTELNGLGVVL